MQRTILLCSSLQQFMDILQARHKSQPKNPTVETDQDHHETQLSRVKPARLGLNSAAIAVCRSAASIQDAVSLYKASQASHHHMQR
ncbi:hypothetical protein BASA61_007538 [Batrachochytrium salamandrivorans]|nr:hypothetical protein BASA61_007538 [Batrachochytrium salamandrivorans]